MQTKVLHSCRASITITTEDVGGGTVKLYAQLLFYCKTQAHLGVDEAPSPASFMRSRASISSSFAYINVQLMLYFTLLLNRSRLRTGSFTTTVQ